MRSSRLLAGVLACALAGACKYPARVAGGNLVAFFSTPARVPNKVEHPVRADARLAVLWVGHATVLLQMDDKILLTDPVLTETAEKLWRRVVEPGIDVANVPPVDAVLISHMHQDHLSLKSLEMLEPKVGMLVLPRGGSLYVPGFSFPSRELPWWHAIEAGGMRITAVPVKHDGSRLGIDGAWRPEGATGYVLEYHGLTVYFGGDASYVQENYTRVAERFPTIDLAILPISPMNPHGLMQSMHMDANEALLAFIDLRAKRIMPIHFDTFINSSDDPGEPAEALRAWARARHVDAEKLAILRIGEQRVLVSK